MDVPAIAPRQRAHIQPSAAGPGASNADDYSRYNRDLPPLPSEESDISGPSQASSPASVTNTITDQNSNPFEKDSEFWFEDGNVVVLAQNTAFRFHKGFMSPHSSKFRDLFSIPQPSPEGKDANETFDGCPVVRVSDTSYDFRELLRAMYDGIRYLDPDQAVTFPVLAALARLSHKYHFNELFADVTYRLERIFPTQLDVWDRCGGVDGHGPNRLSSADVIEALNLLRLIGRRDMIPAALYRCAQLEPRSMVHGEVRAERMTRELLSPPDMELCMKLKEDLMQATACLLTRLYEACDARLTQVYDHPDCPYPRICERGLDTVMGICLGDLREYVSTDPLDKYYTSAAASSPLDREMCHVCGNVLETAYSQERRKIWRELPGLMGICIDVDNWDLA